MNSRLRTVLAVTAITAAAPAVAAAASTRVDVYNPFTASGAPAVHVSQVKHGHCFAGSIPAPRRGAWRCITRHSELLDPCFSSAHAHGFVLCAIDGRWSSVIRLELTRPLNPSDGNTGPPTPSSSFPWALKTTSGLKCMYDYNMPPIVHNRTENYLCNGGAGLWGRIFRAPEPWTIHTAPTGASRASIAVAWF
jgi:hypothetical protein